jgi:hypothetical protein
MAQPLASGRYEDHVDADDDVPVSWDAARDAVRDEDNRDDVGAWDAYAGAALSYVKSLTPTSPDHMPDEPLQWVWRDQLNGSRVCRFNAPQAEALAAITGAVFARIRTARKAMQQGNSLASLADAAGTIETGGTIVLFAEAAHLMMSVAAPLAKEWATAFEGTLPVGDLPSFCSYRMCDALGSLCSALSLEAMAIGMWCRKRRENETIDYDRMLKWTSNARVLAQRALPAIRSGTDEAFTKVADRASTRIKAICLACKCWVAHDLESLHGRLDLLDLEDPFAAVMKEQARLDAQADMRDVLPTPKVSMPFTIGAAPSKVIKYRKTVELQVTPVTLR